MPDLASKGGLWGLCLLPRVLLFDIRYVRYLMAMWWNCFMSVMTSYLGIFSCFNSLIDCSWMAPLTPTATHVVLNSLTYGFL